MTPFERLRPGRRHAVAEPARPARSARRPQPARSALPRRSAGAQRAAGPDGRRRLRRPATLLLAAVVTLAAAVTGTYTYTNFTQHAVNEFAGGAPPGLRLHDDYTKVLDAAYSAKDVYVENYGSVPQFVRVRFAEFMSLDGVPVVAGADRDDPDTWAVHHPADQDADGRADGADGDALHDYWAWTLGGEKWYLPTTNHAQLGDANTADDEFADDADNNPTEYHEGDPGVRQTGPARDVVTMAFWTAHQETGPFWVWDDDGWAYWAEPLQPGEATSLLLSGVTRVQEPVAAEYYYAIDAQLEGITANEIREGSWFSQSAHTRDGAGLTEAAQGLLEGLAQGTPNARTVVVEGPAALAPGTSAALTAHVQPLHQAAQQVTWSLGAADGTVTLTPDPSGTGATLAVGADVAAGATVTVTATAEPADGAPAVSGHWTVTIGPAPL